MKKFLFFIFVIALLVTRNSYAFSIEKNTPYIGFDVGTSQGGMREKYGEKIYAKTIPYGEIFAGFNWDDNWGLQIGYIHIKNKDKNSSLTTGDFFPGNTKPVSSNPNQIYSFSSTVKKNKHFYLGLTKKHYIFDEKSSLFGMFGMSISKMYTMHTVLSVNMNGSIANYQNINFSSKKTKAIPLMKVGIQYYINPLLSLNANLTFLNTRIFKMNNNQAMQAGKRVESKNTFLYGFGINYYL